MSFTVAIRGIPDFMHLQYTEVQSFEEIFSLYRVRVRPALMTGQRAEVFTLDGKRVMLYIRPDEHDTTDVARHCLKNSLGILHMIPKASDPLFLGGAGTGAGGPWLYIQPEAFPGYAEAVAECKRKAKAEAEARARAEAEEEARAEVLSDALAAAVKARGYDEVLKTLQDMGS